MIFKQFYLPSLGHASYFIGSEQTGEALVLDVRRDLDIYFDEARSRGMRIRYATDTHQHNDYLTGICELPARADVQLLASARASLGYGVRKMNDGDRLEMGEVAFEILHTPGHTPEHISLLVTDRSRGDEPALLLSGGALLVGDVARPDLLGGRQEIEEAAGNLCQTLQTKILTLPDFVEVYPTHVAGSLCGGNIGSRLSTTIGYERRMNRLLASITSRDRFVSHCLDLRDLPAVPPYWKRMRKLNQQGPPLVGVLTEPPALRVDEFDRLRDEGAIVLDCRTPEAFGGGHIPGALNVGEGNSFATWAGTVLPAETPYILVLERADALWEICWDLLRIGYNLPKGWLAGGMRAWRTSARPIETLTEWTVWDLKGRLQSEPGLVVLDVRQPQEWASGHIEGALFITGAELPSRFDEVPRDRPVAVICGSGYRSSVATSLLAHKGFTRVANVLGGMSAWKRAGFPSTQDGEQKQ
jgi:hydroxyacylglutathione hydrolase